MIAMKSREFFVCVLLYRAIRKAYIIKAKKRSPSNSKAPGEKRECPGDTKVLRKKGPVQFEGGGEKRGWPGDMKVLGNNAPTIGLLQEEKKSARGRWLVSCSGTRVC